MLPWEDASFVCFLYEGDCIFIPAGTIHVTGEEILICEIQQNPNSTYWGYDYDRRDVNGNPRELHIQKAFDVKNFNEYHQGAYGSWKRLIHRRQTLGRSLPNNYVIASISVARNIW